MLNFVVGGGNTDQYSNFNTNESITYQTSAKHYCLPQISSDLKGYNLGVINPVKYDLSSFTNSSTMYVIENDFVSILNNITSAVSANELHYKNDNPLAVQNQYTGYYIKLNDVKKLYITPIPYPRPDCYIEHYDNETTPIRTNVPDTLLNGSTVVFLHVYYGYNAVNAIISSNYNTEGSDFIGSVIYEETKCRLFGFRNSIVTSYDGVIVRKTNNFDVEYEFKLLLTPEKQLELGLTKNFIYVDGFTVIPLVSQGNNLTVKNTNEFVTLKLKEA